MKGATKCPPWQTARASSILDASHPSACFPLLQIMTGDVSDVPAIISSKGGLKYAGADVDAMRAVGKAYQDRSLQEFQATLQASTACTQHSMHSIQGCHCSMRLLARHLYAGLSFACGPLAAS
jgi:hypothetical protein